MSAETMMALVAALVLALAVTTIAAPSFAQRREVITSRARAIQECSRVERRYSQHIWASPSSRSIELAWRNTASRNNVSPRDTTGHATFDARKLSLLYVQTLQRVEHVVVN